MTLFLDQEFKKFKIRKHRKDCVSYDKIYQIQEKLKLSKGDIEELLCVSNTQRRTYERRGTLPAEKFCGLVRAIQLEATKRANQIIDETNKLLDLDE